jgi:hypothetical protein
MKKWAIFLIPSVFVISFILYFIFIHESKESLFIKDINHDVLTTTASIDQLSNDRDIDKMKIAVKKLNKIDDKLKKEDGKLYESTDDFFHLYASELNKLSKSPIINDRQMEEIRKINLSLKDFSDSIDSYHIDSLDQFQYSLHEFIKHYNKKRIESISNL